MKKHKFQLHHRPKNFTEFIGQKNLKYTLKVLIQSAISRNTSLDHLLFDAKPGFGKTSLAFIIANEMKANLKVVQGNQLEKKSDLLSLFANLKNKDIVFIDEFHAINKSLEEILYSVMEDFSIDIEIGPEGEKRIIRMNLPNFTLIGATTQLEKLSKPILDRFGYIANFFPYKNLELQKIIKNLAKKLAIKIEEESIELISLNCSETPRIAVNLLKRSWDFAIFYEKNSIDLMTLNKTLNYLGIFNEGLNIKHIKYLKLLYEVFKKRSASIEAMSSILEISKNNIIFNIEANLLNLSFIEKSSKGRKITEEGIKYLKKNHFI